MPRNKLSKFEISLREQISKNLKNLCSGLTQNELSEKTGIPTSTLSGYFAMRSTPNAGNVQKIADALHVKKSDIDPRFSQEFINEDQQLSPQDEREIESDLEDMMNSVSSAAYDDNADMEDIEAFKATIKAAMIQAKKIAKKKYTPKKFRKE
nr:MAG TPA: Repressor protein CI [Caudoviricetes sp.]